MLPSALPVYTADLLVFDVFLDRQQVEVSESWAVSKSQGGEDSVVAVGLSYLMLVLAPTGKQLGYVT